MNTITVQTIIQASLHDVWEAYIQPEHIVRWAFASEEWECPHAENDVRVGGKFLTRMQAKEGRQSFGAGFDFTGTYTDVVTDELLKYLMDDGRNAEVYFEKVSDAETKVTVIFDPETLNAPELQKAGWQAILDNFKKYIEETK